MLNDQDKNDGNYDDADGADNDDKAQWINAAKLRKKSDLKRKAHDEEVEQVDSNEIFGDDIDNNDNDEQYSERRSEPDRGSAKQQKRKKEKSGKMSKNRFKAELLRTKAAKQGTKAWLAHLFFDPHK